MLFFCFGLMWVNPSYVIFVFMTMVVFGNPLTLRLANSKAQSKTYNAALVLGAVVGLLLSIYFGLRLITTGK